MYLVGTGGTNTRFLASLIPLRHQSLQYFYIRPLHNIISKPKVFLVKEYTRIKIILIASYFFSKIELATIDVHFSCRTIWLVHSIKASCDWVIIFGDVYWTLKPSLPLL
ncbi:MAG: hypothetical protein EWV40_19025 [Microcystis flos-aquae Mf_WU_F_19750830_S460]|uniref:Uncharacterized protein n=1 Tax=Microcystis flos-aquae Mf_WU_F_19750830_S460 TaxID=2486237 RepID=A0A552LAS1_9CHRO|nr:MAG: hypothetical protein EWV40_19025 [Microcystis flos-aquae Mf_WU_F_19750830_S460]